MSARIRSMQKSMAIKIQRNFSILGNTYKNDPCSDSLWYYMHGVALDARAAPGRHPVQKSFLCFFPFTPPSFSIRNTCYLSYRSSSACTYHLSPSLNKRDDYHIISQIQHTKLQSSDFLDCFPKDHLREGKKASLPVS
jgi:hypothetical protein